jgi:hypothetical protein
MNTKTFVRLAALAGLFGTASVGATTIPLCNDQIDVLKAQTAAAPFKNQKDEDGEVAKLMDAKLKLNVAKLADAKQKIADYVTKLNQVNAAGKLDDPTGQTYMTLSNGAAGVTSCIDNIGK